MFELVALLLITLIGALIISEYYIRKEHEDSKINLTELLRQHDFDQIWYAEHPAPAGQPKKKAPVLKLKPESKAKAIKRKLKKVPRKKTTDKKKPR